MNFHKSKKIVIRPKEKGLTLVELLVTITIMGIIAAAAIPLLSTCLEAYSQGNARSGLYREGLLAMERMTSGVRSTSFLLIPNGHKQTRNILAVSGMINNDNDFYFGDPLFPRIDEDTGSKMMGFNDGVPGYDDDGDGQIDERDSPDDEEDGTTDEEILNGTDDDSDGNIDEDLDSDADSNGFPGIQGSDDDGDGQVDEMFNNNYKDDDDEDGSIDEDFILPRLYTFESASNTLYELVADSGNWIEPSYSYISVALSNHVSSFSVTYEMPDATHAPRILISLTLTGDDGESITFTEYAYPRNTLQKTGKRAR